MKLGIPQFRAATAELPSPRKGPTDRLLGVAMKTETIFRQFNGKRRWVRSLLVPALNRLVGDEPGIAPAPPVRPCVWFHRLMFDLCWYGTPMLKSINLDTLRSW